MPQPPERAALRTQTCPPDLVLRVEAWYCCYHHPAAMPLHPTPTPALAQCPCGHLVQCINLSNSPVRFRLWKGPFPLPWADGGLTWGKGRPGRQMSWQSDSPDLTEAESMPRARRLCKQYLLYIHHIPLRALLTKQGNRSSERLSSLEVTQQGRFRFKARSWHSLVPGTSSTPGPLRRQGSLGPCLCVCLRPQGLGRHCLRTLSLS